MADKSVLIEFRGDAASFVASVKQMTAAMQGVTGQINTLKTQMSQLQTSSDKTTAASKRMGASTVALGSLMGNLAMRALAAGKHIFAAFGDAGVETRKLQLAMGGTAEEMSSLRAVAMQFKIPFDALIVSYRTFAREVQTNTRAAKELGITLKDENGNVKSSIELIKEAADKFNNMSDATSRTAVFGELFGRRFKELAPVLALGSKGIDQAMQDVKRLGLTMDEKGVSTAVHFRQQMNTLKGAMSGLSIAVANDLVPVLSTLIGGFTVLITKVTDFIAKHQTFIKILALIAGAIAAVVIQVKLAAAAQAIWNAELLANPIGAAILLLEGLAAILVYLIKTYPQASEVISYFGEVLGGAVGAGVADAINAVGALAVTVIGLARAFAWGAEVMTGNRLWKWITGDEGETNKAIKDTMAKLDNLDTQISLWTNKVTKNMSGKGAQIGKDFGAGLAKSIKDFKMPDFKVPDFKTPDTGDQTLDSSGKKGKKKKTKTPAQLLKEHQKDFKERLDATKNYWKEVIKTAREAYDAAKKAAEDAAKELKDAAANIASTLAQGFDIVALTEGSFAKYLGADYLISAFRKKLADAREFATDLGILKDKKLPVSMLKQMADAGFEAGLPAARLLVNNQGAIDSLTAIQSEIDSITTRVGETLAPALPSTAVPGTTMGQAVADTAKSAADAAQALKDTTQSGVNAVMGMMPEGQKVGMGSDVLEAAQDLAKEGTKGTDVSVTVNAQTNADPQAIADTVAWALTTGNAAESFAASIYGITGTIMNKSQLKTPPKPKKQPKGSAG